MNTRVMFARLLRGIAELPVERVIREHLLFHALAGLGQVPAVAYAASLTDAADASDEPGLIRFAEVAAGEIFAKISADSAVAGLVTPASALFPVLVDGAVGQCIPAEGVAGAPTPATPPISAGEEVAGLAGPVTSRMSNRRSLGDSKEVAAYIKVPVRTLDQWAYQGTGPKFVKVGRHRRYRWEDVERWLDQKSSSGPWPLTPGGWS